MKDITETVNKSIENLTKKVAGPINSTDALRYTQAALNLAHIRQVIKQIESDK